MPKPYSPDKFWEYYETVPPELQEALFSSEVAEKIKRIGKIYDLKSETVGKISGLLAEVFLGLLSPDEFEEELKKEIPEEKEYIKEIAHDIWRLIFFPLKDVLAQVYKLEEKKIFKEVPKIEIPSEKKEKIKEEKEKPSFPPKKEEEEFKILG